MKAKDAGWPFAIKLRRHECVRLRRNTAWYQAFGFLLSDGQAVLRPAVVVGRIWRANSPVFEKYMASQYHGITPRKAKDMRDRTRV